MVFISTLIRFLLLWWIVSTVWNWLTKTNRPGNAGNSRSAHRAEPKQKSNINDIPVNKSTIEDADFEEIDGA